MSENIVFKCVEITQPIGSFYVGAIHSADLVAIGYADVMRIKDKEDDFDEGTR